MSTTEHIEIPMETTPKGNLLENVLAETIQHYLDKTKLLPKADKCVNLAINLLGCTATDAEVEALANEWMDKPDEELEAAIRASRLATEKKE